jgi:hypothetical protein
VRTFTLGQIASAAVGSHHDGAVLVLCHALRRLFARSCRPPGVDAAGVTLVHDRRGQQAPTSMKVAHAGRT